MLMRSLESALIPRRDNNATAIGGYELLLNRLLDRANSHEGSLAIPRDKVRDFYDVISNVEKAILTINYMLAQVQGMVPSQRRQEELRAAATHACEELVRGRRILGDNVRVASPISEHQPDDAV
jgi:hypothetical protein